MTLTNNEDGTTTINASGEETEHLWAAAEIQAYSEDNNENRRALYARLAKELAKTG